MVRIYSVVFSPRHSESKLSLCSRLSENVQINSVVFSPRHSESKLSLCSRLGENIRMNVKSTLQLFVLFLSLSFAGNLWAQQVSSQNTIYAYKIQNQADGRAYYFVATTDGGQQRIKTSNNGTLTNSNDAYWYFVHTNIFSRFLASA